MAFGRGGHGIPVPDYKDMNVSMRVVKTIQSYTGIVDRMEMERRGLKTIEGINKR